MYCEKYKATIPEKTCVARQGRDGKIAPYNRSVTDPGCQNCAQGRQVMADFKKNKKTEKTMIDTAKICKKCEKPFPPDKAHFYGDKRTPDGLSNYCKVCHNALSGKTKKTRPSPDKALNDVKKQEFRTVLTIDFSGHQDLLEEIREAASNEFRTPEMQVLWRLSTPKTDTATRSL